MTTLIGHLESRLGSVRHGWSRNQQGVELPFQVVEMGGGGQLPGSTSFSTLGLSDHRLRAGTGKVTYQELVMTIHAAQAPARLPQVLQFVGTEQIAGHAPILRGQTIALPGDIAAGCGLSSLYAAIPGYFDPDFDVVTLDDGRDVVISWMVPISEAERIYVEENGWKSFERKLTESDPDLLDIFRDSLV